MKRRPLPLQPRKNLRLVDYDYSNQGFYFLTICTQKWHCYFGTVKEFQNYDLNCQQFSMHLNDAGKMVEKWYFELENKFRNLICHEYVVMPNHFHCIVEIRAKLISIKNLSKSESAGFAEGINPEHKNLVSPSDISGGRVNSLQSQNTGLTKDFGQAHELGQTHRSAPTITDQDSETIGIPDVMQWFKTMTTNEYIRGVKEHSWTPFDKKLWQRSYHDHIIRNQHRHQTIINYIIDNPNRWKNDKFYPDPISRL